MPPARGLPAAAALALLLAAGCRPQQPAPTPTPRPPKPPLPYHRVPILCYHRLAEEPALYVETPQRFAQQMAFLAEEGYQTISAADLVAYLEGDEDLPEKPIIITFDDGLRSVYTQARPLLQKHGFTATLFLIAGSVGGEDSLTWDQVRRLHAAGYEIGSHTLTHAMLTRRREGESESDWRRRLGKELADSKAKIEAEIGDTIVALAYPNGLYDDFAVVNAVREAGYTAALTIDRGPADQHSHPLLLPRQQVIGVNSMERFRQQVRALPLNLEQAFPRPGGRISAGDDLFSARLLDDDVTAASLTVDIDGARQQVTVSPDGLVEFRPGPLSRGAHNLRMTAKVPTGTRDRSWVFIVEPS
ncbi:MAG: polysaccharide deacetylase family protein [Armatimonadota bacterium]